jgi:hypothetical protein
MYQVRTGSLMGNRHTYWVRSGYLKIMTNADTIFYGVPAADRVLLIHTHVYTLLIFIHRIAALMPSQQCIKTSALHHKYATPVWKFELLGLFSGHCLANLISTEGGAIFNRAVKGGIPTLARVGLQILWRLYQSVSIRLPLG